MKEYAFLPASQLDPLRDQFLPSKVAKKLQCCIEGARKEKLEINSVIEVRTYGVVLHIAVMFNLPVFHAEVLSCSSSNHHIALYCEDFSTEYFNVRKTYHSVISLSTSCLISY